MCEKVLHMALISITILYLVYSTDLLIFTYTGKSFTYIKSF